MAPEEMTEEKKRTKAFVEDFGFFYREVRTITREGEHSIPDDLIVQLYDQYTRMRNTDKINARRGPPPTTSTPPVDSTAKPPAGQNDSSQGKKSGGGRAKDPIPPQCMGCSARCGKTEPKAFCKEYNTHVWAAAKECSQNVGGG